MGNQAKEFSGQYGEDRFLIEHKLVPARGVFVDVGAGDPVRFSNTYYLEQLGWKGLCIDADPKQIEALTKRRTCAVEWAAVTSDDGEVELLQCEDPDYSTTLDHLPTVAANRGLGYRLTRVPALKLETILEKHNIETINLLSVDTEGNELDVCETLDWDKHRPRVVVIEYFTWDRPSQEEAIRDYFAGLPYRLVHRTTANLIFKEAQVRRLLRRPSPVRTYLASQDKKRFPVGIEIDSAGQAPAHVAWLPATPYRRRETSLELDAPLSSSRSRLKPWSRL